MELLKDEADHIYRIGAWLKLSQVQLDVIRTQSAGRTEAMEKIISSWLRGKYNTEMFGPPTWKMLVKAVGASTGGNNMALAEKIAKAHLLVPQASPVSLINV